MQQPTPEQPEQVSRDYFLDFELREIYLVHMNGAPGAGDTRRETMTRPGPGFYGTDLKTYFVTKNGRIWVVQNPDGARAFELDALPEDAEELPPALCHDVDLSEISDDSGESATYRIEVFTPSRAYDDSSPLATAIDSGDWELQPNGGGFSTLEEAETAMRDLVETCGYNPERLRIVEEPGDDGV
jgi:hypothetical protein